jgi:hypothetical protein
MQRRSHLAAAVNPPRASLGRRARTLDHFGLHINVDRRPPPAGTTAICASQLLRRGRAAKIHQSMPGAWIRAPIGQHRAAGRQGRGMPPPYTRSVNSEKRALAAAERVKVGNEQSGARPLAVRKRPRKNSIKSGAKSLLDVPRRDGMFPALFTCGRARWPGTFLCETGAARPQGSRLCNPRSPGNSTPIGTP